MRHSPETIDAFKVLVPFGGIGEALCRLAGEGQLAHACELRVICTSLSLAQSRAADVERALEAGQSVGLFERATALSWRATNQAQAKVLQPLLEGAWVYRSQFHQDDNVVDVVLTTPPEPSAMADELERTLHGRWGLQDTRELLPAIAESARESFTIVSPFLDDVGAGIVANLFEQAKVPHRTLVLRSDASGALPPGLAGIRESLLEMGVEVVNFHLARQAGGFETFHAKVMLADRASAYLGSANMLKWSFEYSLEMGLYVRGKAAARIADVLAAIEAVSVRVS